MAFNTFKSTASSFSRAHIAHQHILNGWAFSGIPSMFEPGKLHCHSVCDGSKHSHGQIKSPWHKAILW